MISSVASPSTNTKKISKHSYKYHIKKGRHINHLPLHLVSSYSHSSNELQNNSNTSSVYDDHDIYVSSNSNSTFDDSHDSALIISSTSQSNNKSFSLTQVVVILLISVLN